MPFTGPSGDILWQMVLREMSLTREEVYTDNFSQKMWEEDEKGEPVYPTPEEEERLARELRGRLVAVNPEYIITLGRFSTRALLGDVSMEETHGIPYGGNWCGLMAVIPVFHPAAGMHEPSRLAFTSKDLQAAAKVIRGEVGPAPGPAPTRIRPYRIGAPHLGLMKNRVAVDTEWGPDGKPLMLSWSCTPGTGYVIMADDALRLRQFERYLAQVRPTVVFHNALADLEPLRLMGIDIIGMGLKIVDTMILAYHHQTEPRGLKMGARRFLGLQMRDYEDVVGPYYRADLLEYVQSAFEVTKPLTIPRFGKRGQLLKPKPEPASRAHKRVRRLLADVAKDPMTDPEPRWKKWVEDGVVADLEAELAPVPVKSLALVPTQEAIDYSAEDAAATIHVEPVWQAMVYNRELVDRDHSVLPLLDRMQQTGLPVDLGVAKQLLDEVLAHMAELDVEIKILTGNPDFNPGSGDDIGDWILLESLTVEKHTKTGKIATGKKELAKLVPEHPAVPKILEWKTLEKLRSTYLGPLPGFVGPDGRLHPRYRHTVVPSGRLSAADPNVMAWPVRSSWGRRVRSTVVAGEGRLLGSWDLSQIEVRVTADESADPILVRALIDGIDIHSNTAKLIFGVSESVSGFDLRYRLPAKTVTFLVLYGGGPEKLLEELLALGVTGFDLAACKALISDWFTLYNGVRDYRDHIIQGGRRHGYVEDRWGRRRWLPGLSLSGSRWPQSKLREEAERQGFNHRIQGGADGYIKRAMVRMWADVLPAVRLHGYAEPLLQIHDELMAEVDEGLWAEMNERMLAAMTADSDTLLVPIKASGTSARSWGALKG